jgi:hypothetical protein
MVAEDGAHRDLLLGRRLQLQTHRQVVALLGQLHIEVFNGVLKVHLLRLQVVLAEISRLWDMGAPLILWQEFVVDIGWILDIAVRIFQ